MVSKGPATMFLCLLLGAFTRGASPQQAFRVEPDNITVPGRGCGCLAVRGGQSLRRGPVGEGWVAARTGHKHPWIPPLQYDRRPSKSAPQEHPSSRITEVNSTVTWVAGVEYRVTCSSGDAKPAAEIFFSKGGSPLSDVSHQVHSGSSEKLSSTEAVLRVTPQSLDNRKRLVCAATNEAVSAPVVAGFTMNILFPPEPPTIEGYKRPEIKAGETLKLTCISLSGNPLATLQWLKNGKVVSTSWETEDARGAFPQPPDPQHQTRGQRGSAALRSHEPGVTPAPDGQCHPARGLSPHRGFHPGLQQHPGEQADLALLLHHPQQPPGAAALVAGLAGAHHHRGHVTEAAHGGTVTVSNLTHMAGARRTGCPSPARPSTRLCSSPVVPALPLSVQYPPQRCGSRPHP
ncbi:unnamed protein product [Natator depressus]